MPMNLEAETTMELEGSEVSGFFSIATTTVRSKTGGFILLFFAVLLIVISTYGWWPVFTRDEVDLLVLAMSVFFGLLGLSSH